MTGGRCSFFNFLSGHENSSCLILVLMELAPNPGLSRIRGWLLIVIGVGLSLGMVWVAWFLSWTIAHNGQPGRSHWNGAGSSPCRYSSCLEWPFSSASLP